MTGAAVMVVAWIFWSYVAAAVQTGREETT